MHHTKPSDPLPTSVQRPPFPDAPQRFPGSEGAMKTKPDHGEQRYVGHALLRDRVAIVTGGDSGIGRAVALAYAREGADLAIGYYDEHEDAEETKRLVEQAGRRALLLPGDLADVKTCERVVDATLEAFGRLDVLVNNAAFQGKAERSFLDIDAARIDRAFRVNIEAMFHTVRRAVPHMAAGSAIINVASIQAYQPNASILDYATTKGAIVAFTKGLADELAEKGIRVNCVAPGPVWTPLIVQSFDQEKIRSFGENYPMKRPAQPAELAPAFVFLATDASSYVNGEVLGVTGGRPLA